MVPDKAGDEPAMGRGMRGIERGQRRLFIIQGDEIAIGLRRQLRRWLRTRAFRAEHATFANAEGHSAGDGIAVSDTGVELRREPRTPTRSHSQRTAAASVCPAAARTSASSPL